MFAKNLEITLTSLSQKSDGSGVSPNEMADRFKALRANRRLPYGRERRDQALTTGEIAAAILGLASNNPEWAGHVAIVLCNLRPVGGVDASFFGNPTLQKSIERILTDVTARKSVIGLTISGAESGTNSHGYAMLTYEIDGTRRQASYVPKEAVSRLLSGAERDFDPEMRNASVSRETSFSQDFFRRIAREIEMAKAHPVPPAGDGSEYETEEARQERYRGLGVRPGSRFLNIGIDNQLTWPQQETVVRFDRYQFVLMPNTRDHVQSIHIDLATNRLTDHEAMTIINRFLSIMTWCDDQFAIAQDGWSGNPVPVPVPRRNLASTITHHWIFDRQIPASKKARRAVALYREARNAQQNFLVSYAVLNFYKIVELKSDVSGEVKNWFRDNFERLAQDQSYRDIFVDFVKICGSEKPHEYIWKACRVAVAHANKHSQSDPDDANEVARLHTAADVLRIFARHFIKTELGISDVMYSGK
jgi:hypothetical protein